MMNTTLDFKSVPLFKDLSNKELRSLTQHLQERSFEKGEMLFEQAQSCENIIIVKSGRVKLFRLSSSGQEQILEVLQPGDTCACNPGKPEWSCSSWAQALSECTVWTLGRKHYAQMVKSNSQLSQTLTALFADRLCKFCSLIEQVSLETPQRRLVKFLLDMIDPSAVDSPKGYCLNFPFTHEEIAQRLGLARETVSRQLAILKKTNLIRIEDDKITIRDRKALELILA